MVVAVFAGIALAADIVPTDIQQPGTQPREIGNLESPDKCDNYHGGYNTAVEPAFNWRGSMMANAGRDPIFWSTLAIAEQDFDGAGNLCLRCHSTAGWQAGRSTPTGGSGLVAGVSAVFHAYVIDASTGLPVANATVDLAITGPESFNLTTNPSDNTGMAEGSWSTSAPNKRGQGGTTPGTYSATVTNVNAAGYTWDGVSTSVSFTLE